MNKLKAVFLLTPLLVAACSSDSSMTPTAGAALRVNVGINYAPTRSTPASITPDLREAFSHGDKIGVRLIDDAGTNNNYNFPNLPYTAEGPNEELTEQLWSTTVEDVIITDNYARVMAYYPYYDNSVDITAININCGEGTDHMYCPYSYNGNDHFNYTDPYRTFAMQHAQSIIKVVLKNTPGKDAYTGDETLKRLTVTGGCFALSGKLDATTGTLSAQTGNSLVVNYDGTETLSNIGDQHFYVLTTGTESTITFTLEIGDTPKFTVTTTAAITMQQGYIYAYELTITDTILRVNSVIIMPWTDETTIPLDGQEES